MAMTTKAGPFARNLTGVRMFQGGIHRAFSKMIGTFYSQPSPFDFSTFNDFKIDSDDVHGFWLDLRWHN